LLEFARDAQFFFFSGAYRIASLLNVFIRSVMSAPI
jgi:hypothetical protein